MSDEENAVIETDDAETGGEDQVQIEQRARAQGWRPQDEYSKLTGADPKKWVDASTFLERGEKSLPILKERNRKLESDMKDMRALVREVLANQKADRDRTINETITKLNAEKREAIAEADANKVVAIDAQIDKLKEAPKAPVAEKEAAAAEAREPFTSWAKQNPWFNPKSQAYDIAMASLANGYYDMLCADGETSDLDDGEKLKRVSVEMRKRFPEKFQNKRRAEAPQVEGATAHVSRANGKKTFADLPQEAQEICDRLIRQKVIKSRDAYIADYPFS